jgi:threonine 3-dehydrogenase
MFTPPSIPHRKPYPPVRSLHRKSYPLEACRSVGVRQLMFTSTIAVFGPGLPEVVGDDVGLRPTTMYGVTKAACEMLGEYYFARYGLDVRGVRFPGLITG